MSRPDILCIGAVHWDTIGYADRPMTTGADRPGRVIQQPGGVAFNLARQLRCAGMAPALLAALGESPDAAALARACAAAGVSTEYLYRAPDLPTDRYVALEGPEGLFGAVADTRALEAAGARILAPLADGRLGGARRPWGGCIALDGNLPAPVLAEIAAGPLVRAADLRLAAPSPDKAARLSPFLGHANALFYLNLAEAARLCDTPFGSAPEAATALLARGAARVLVTDGDREIAEAGDGRYLRRTPPASPADRVTGAGDTLMAAHIAAELRGADRDAALDAAVAAAGKHIGASA